jgi:hypothetical protein
MIDTFWYFVNERAAIWRRRFIEKKAPPWTDDPILQRYKFCNVWRELDRGTQFVIQNIVLSDMSPQQKLLHLIVYRWFNLPSTYDMIRDCLDMDSLDLETAVQQLRLCRERGVPVFSDAYMISGRSSVSQESDKSAMLLLGVVKNWLLPRLPDIYKKVSEANRMEEAWNVLRKVPNLGEFIAYQVLLDWSYLPEVDFIDFNYWVYPGPGAIKGLSYLDVDGGTYEDKIRKLTENQVLVWKWNGHDLHVHNVENCLCEFGKYMRLKTNAPGRHRLYKSAGDWDVEEIVDPWLLKGVKT